MKTLKTIIRKIKNRELRAYLNRRKKLYYSVHPKPFFVK